MVKLPATEFKAHCLAVLDRVCRTGEEVTITKRGRPVARLLPPTRGGGSPLEHPLIGTVEVVGDIIAPVLGSTAWAALRTRRNPSKRRPSRRGGRA